MDHKQNAWTNLFCWGKWESLFQQYLFKQLFQVNPSLVTNTPGAPVSGETMQKHWIFSKTGRAREVSRLGDRGCAGPNEVGFLVWSCNWNFLKI